ncbi:hypothetical protein [Hymenobacter cheonanensis]|uniref:hypothetical protein n=1 Tax=Hymenobacter sp. CA2-7 TaxID=3063993 RepID=UPI0027123878|nr:hypothetical protein [Hymenobacter sp. CA2-7]MDO7887893.1 hypothetical protein [Hymenobacter sp. CA2-7]
MSHSVKQLGLHMLWGTSVVLGGLFCYLIVTLLIGYIPYSDRPGPGWHPGAAISLAEIQFIGGFLLFMSIYWLPTLLLLYFLFRLLRLIGYNKLIYAVLGGIIIGIAAGYWTLAIGWYIALDESTVWAGSVLGLLYGAILFPKFLKPTVTL